MDFYGFLAGVESFRLAFHSRSGDTGIPLIDLFASGTSGVSGYKPDGPSIPDGPVVGGVLDIPAPLPIQDHCRFLFPAVSTRIRSPMDMVAAVPGSYDRPFRHYRPSGPDEARNDRRATAPPSTVEVDGVVASHAGGPPGGGPSGVAGSGGCGAVLWDREGAGQEDKRVTLARLMKNP
jgi:hypothetical protein